MSWQDLLSDGETRTLPWVGGRSLTYGDRTWTLKGKTPAEHGWYTFRTDGGRTATLVGSTDPDPEFETHHSRSRGYLVGDRLILDDARVHPDPDRLIEQTHPVFIIEPGLERFTRAVAGHTPQGLIYIRQEFPQGPEAEVTAAYQDRLASVDHIPGVTPALDLAFRWLTYQREQAEERAREWERQRAEELAREAAAERFRQAVKNAGTAAGRRVLAPMDFETAARGALAVSGAELLDTRPSFRKGEMIVQYRFMQRRLECVVDQATLRIVDAGVCLDDHHGTKGDTFFTLESLPAVIREALNRNKLVVWRHVPGDHDPHRHDWDDDDDD